MYVYSEDERSVSLADRNLTGPHLAAAVAGVGPCVVPPPPPPTKHNLKTEQTQSLECTDAAAK
jgi:hypothetical protein